jgi:hypothetical protein
LGKHVGRAIQNFDRRIAEVLRQPFWRDNVGE